MRRSEVESNKMKNRESISNGRTDSRHPRPYQGIWEPVIPKNVLPHPLYLNFKRLAFSTYFLSYPKFYKQLEDFVRTELNNNRIQMVLRT